MKVTIEAGYSLDDIIEDFQKNGFMRFHHMKCQWVSEGMKDKFEYDNAKAIFIDSGCGTGKNYWIDNEIINKKGKQLKKDILFLSDRTANNMQSKKRIAKELECDYILELTNEELKKRTNFAGVQIKTYQKTENDIFEFKMERELLNKYGKVKGARNLEDLKEKYNINSVDYIIFDECQAFLNDAFNYKFAKLWEDLIDLYPNAVRIYCTATPNQIFPILLEKEKDLIERSSAFKIQSFNSQYGNNKNSSTSLISYYRFERDFSHIKKINFFQDHDDLCGLYKDIEEDSTLTIVDSIAEGDKIKALLGDNAVFISSNGIDTNKEIASAYNFIIENEKLPCKHCIATTVILDGINLKYVDGASDRIKHIILFLHDEDSIIQAIGRVRKAGKKDIINVYFKDLGKKELWQYLFKLKNRQDTIDLFYKYPQRFRRKYNEHSEDYKGLFYLNDNGTISINQYAEVSNKQSYLIFQEYFQNYDEKPYQFLEKKCSWLQKNIHITKKHRVSYGANIELKKEFDDFLVESLNKPMDKQQFDEFCKQFYARYIKAYGSRKSDNTSRDTYGVYIIRETLVNLKKPYTLISKEKVYTLTEKAA